MEGGYTEVICELEGEVVHGKGMGRILGFPTANLAIAHALHIRFGVYAASVCIENKWYAAIVNVGRHPTLPNGPSSVEAHIIDYHSNLYGKTLIIQLFSFLREEQKFASIDALREQIQRDIDRLK